MSLHFVCGVEFVELAGVVTMVDINEAPAPTATIRAHRYECLTLHNVTTVMSRHVTIPSHEPISNREHAREEFLKSSRRTLVCC